MTHGRIAIILLSATVLGAHSQASGQAANHASQIYWSDGRRIYRAGLDGSNVEVVLQKITEHPRALALDMAAGKIYWADSAGPNPGKIQRAQLDGSNIEDLIIGLSDPVGLALHLDAGKVYWTDTS